MEAAVNSTIVLNPETVPSAAPDYTSVPETAHGMSVADSPATAMSLGIWLTSLKSFLNIRNHSITEENRTRAAHRDWSGEFRLTQMTLLRCSRLSYELIQRLEQLKATDADFDSSPVSVSEVFVLTRILKTRFCSVKELCAPRRCRLANGRLGAMI